MKSTQSLELACQFLGKKVIVKTDRPLGSKHPKYNFIYAVNYGYIHGVTAPDGACLDAYILGIEESVEQFEGICIRVIHRNDDDDDKLVVVPENNCVWTDESIMSQVSFQEQWFDSTVIRKKC